MGTLVTTWRPSREAPSPLPVQVWGGGGGGGVSNCILKLMGMPIEQFSVTLQLFGSDYSWILFLRRRYPGKSIQVYSWSWSCFLLFNFSVQVIGWIVTPLRIQFLSKDTKNWVSLFSYKRWFGVNVGWIILILALSLRFLEDISPFQYWDMNKQIISWGRPAKGAAYSKVI